ncbi:MAG: chaperone modulator CbpM [Limibacillus sp.]|jgi:chaperone modulatory protein CbpM
MKRVEDLLEQITALQRSDLETWIREEMITPQDENSTVLFSESECARIRLVCTLHYDLEIDLEALPTVLSLVDELYETRQQLLSLTAAVAAQDKAIQSAILAALKS